MIDFSSINYFFTKNIFNENYYFFILILIFSFSTTNIIIPFLLSLGNKLNWKDYPNVRKQHKKPIINIGGFGIYLPFIIVNLLILFNQKIIGIGINKNLIITIIISSSVMFFLGLLDDIRNISPWPRLSIQICLALYIWANGFAIHNINFNLPFQKSYELLIPDLVSIFLSLIWFVGITNAINWIDGLDGLAGGVSALIFTSLCVINLNFNNSYIAIISATLAASCFAFLRYNKYPAKIHMGDGGANFLGITLSLLSILTFYNSYNFDNDPYFSINLYIPLLLLFLPILDMSTVLITRIINGNSIFLPDRSHIHHRLLNKGVKYENTVISIYLITFLSCLIALFLSNTINYFFILLLSLLILKKLF